MNDRLSNLEEQKRYDTSVIESVNTSEFGAKVLG